jgi:MFS family permease
MKIDIPARLTGLFFISGFAALIYQVVWQRILFTTFGINADSVTVIVSVFMFGLGMGTLAGNWLQKKFPHRLLDFFIAIEIGIGLFGLFSIPLIKQASAFAPPDSLLALMGITYAVLALPTLLMGATLPLLVTYLNLHFANIGQTVGKLYAFNTLGSAIAALMTVSFLFVVTGQQGALTLAFCCNILTAFLTYRLRRFALGKAATNRKTIPKNAIPFALALLLSATAGYVGLSLQMFWFRTIGFMSSGRSEAFGLILFLFLCGVAGGSRKTEQLSEAGENLALFIVKSLALLALSIYVSLVIVAAVASLDQVLGTYVAYGFLALQARISGGIFPALCHLGIKQSAKVQPGIAVGWMYFSNRHC